MAEEIVSFNNKQIERCAMFISAMGLLGFSIIKAEGFMLYFKCLMKHNNRNQKWWESVKKGLSVFGFGIKLCSLSEESSNFERGFFIPMDAHLKTRQEEMFLSAKNILVKN